VVENVQPDKTADKLAVIRLFRFSAQGFSTHSCNPQLDDLHSDRAGHQVESSVALSPFVIDKRYPSRSVNKVSVVVPDFASTQTKPRRGIYVTMKEREGHRLSRRQFLLTGTLAGGGLMLPTSVGAQKPMQMPMASATATPPVKTGPAAVTLHIGPVPRRHH
jgi:hypothetical protein